MSNARSILKSLFDSNDKLEQEYEIDAIDLLFLILGEDFTDLVEKRIGPVVKRFVPTVTKNVESITDIYSYLKTFKTRIIITEQVINTYSKEDQQPESPQQREVECTEDYERTRDDIVGECPQFGVPQRVSSNQITDNGDNSSDDEDYSPKRRRLLGNEEMIAEYLEEKKKSAILVDYNPEIHNPLSLTPNDPKFGIDEDIRVVRKAKLDQDNCKCLVLNSICDNGRRIKNIERHYDASENNRSVDGVSYSNWPDFCCAATGLTDAEYRRSLALYKFMAEYPRFRNIPEYVSTFYKKKPTIAKFLEKHPSESAYWKSGCMSIEHAPNAQYFDFIANQWVYGSPIF